MTRRVIVAHGWEGHPQEGWFPWLKKELEAQNVEVIIPQLPEPDRPRIEKWVPRLAEVTGSIDENTFFVGHSMGCQAIARLLQQSENDNRAGGVVFVAGFFKHLTGLEADPEVQKTDKHWLEAPIDLKSVRKSVKASVAIFSKDDPWVPLDNKIDFEKILGSKIVIKDAMGHFSGGRDGVFQLPVVLEELQNLFDM